MDNSTHDNEQLMRYLDDEMEGQEKTNFEKRLSADPRLQEELSNLQLAERAVHSFGITSQVSNVHQLMMNEIKPQAIVKNINNRRRILRYTILAAASILLIFIGMQVYSFIDLSGEKLFKEKYTAYELSTMRDPNAPPEPAIEKLYRQKNYKAVIDLINKSTDISPKEQFLAGLSYLELNELPKAITSFNEVIHEDQSANKQRAEYYLALTYLKIKDYDKALEIMQVIHKNHNHSYFDKFSNNYIRRVQMLKWK